METMANILDRLRGKPSFDPTKVHYLHIGKTAGNQIKTVCKQIEELDPRIRFELHSHGTHLYRLPDAARYFFSIRHPVTRFKAGFYERKRQGRNGGNFWSEHERMSFEVFQDAADLAEVLFDKSQQGELARSSMHSIQHVRKTHFTWFHPHGHFLTARPPVWILRQENFEADLETFSQRLGLDGPPDGRADAYRGKITDYSEIPELSAKGVKNLERWYSADIAFYEDCSRWLDKYN